jgi:hypothetical protein
MELPDRTAFSQNTERLGHCLVVRESASMLTMNAEMPSLMLSLGRISHLGVVQPVLCAVRPRAFLVRLG